VLHILVLMFATHTWAYAYFDYGQPTPAWAAMSPTTPTYTGLPPICYELFNRTTTPSFLNSTVAAL